MIRKLLTFVFIVAVAGNSLAAVSSTMESDCMASCCQVARAGGEDATLAGLCCIMDCQQPGGTHAPTPIVSVSEKRQKNSATAHQPHPLQSLLKTQPPSDSYSSLQYLSGSSNLYLKTGSFLI